MTDIENIIGIFHAHTLKHLSRKRRRKVLTDLMFDKEFIKWLFQPEKTANLSQQVEDLYEELIKPYTMESLIDVIEYEGYSEFNRSHATFITTICNIAIDRNNEELKTYEKKKKDPDVPRMRLRGWADKIDHSNRLIAGLLKRARRIIKRQASVTAKKSRLPKYITKAAYTSIPETKYIDRFKIGYYMNNLMNTIYSDVETNGEFLDDVRWKEFFSDVFGKSNVVECATFILLEGVHRIDKYRNSRDVICCWDSLTDFALAELNKAPDNTREQMLELYIKRLDKMFSNKSFDLRTNLLDVQKMIWPNLWKTVQKYATKLGEIINRGLDIED